MFYDGCEVMMQGQYQHAVDTLRAAAAQKDGVLTSTSFLVPFTAFDFLPT